MANRGQAVFSGGVPGTAGATHYFVFMGDSAAGDVNSTELNNKQVISAAGTIDSLYVNLGTAPGSGESIVITLRVNGSDTALTATISGTATTGSDISHSVSVAAGDVVGWKIVSSNNGAYAAANGRYSARFIPTTTDNFNILFGIAGAGDQWDNTTTSQYTPAMSKRGKNATENLRSQVMPCAGTIKNLYVNINTAPGVGKTRTFTVFKNGVATTLLVVISGTNTSGNDTTHTVSYVAGDTISVECKADSGSANTKGGYGVSFVPTTASQFPVMECDANAQSTSAVNYIAPGTGGGSWNATESIRQMLAPMKLALVASYVSVNTAPAAGKSWTFVLRKNSADTDLSAAITDTNTAGNDTSSSQTIAAADLLSISCTPAGTPTASGANRISYCFFESYDLAQTATETVSLTSSLVKGPQKLFAEATMLSDVLTALVARTATLLESFAVTDSLVKSGTKLLSEASAFADSLIKTGTRILIESFTITDVLTALGLRVQTLIESFTLTDSFVRAITKNLTESPTISDSLNKSSGRTLAESTTVTDTLTKIPGKILSESVSITDLLNRIAGKVLAEAATITDSIAKTHVFNRILTETLTITDFLSKTIGRILSESFSAVDTIQKLLNGFLAIYSDKYSSRGTSSSDKYSTRGSTYTDKYTHLS